jgi:hypothetical protein
VKAQKVTGGLEPPAAVSILQLWLPTLDNLRNFFLTLTTEMLSFLQWLRGVF